MKRIFKIVKYHNKRNQKIAMMKMMINNKRKRNKMINTQNLERSKDTNFFKESHVDRLYKLLRCLFLRGYSAELEILTYK